MSLTTVLNSELLQHPLAIWNWWTAELHDFWRSLPFQRSAAPHCLIHLDRDTVTVDRITDGNAERFVEHQCFEDLSDDGFAELRDLADDTTATVLLSPPDIYATAIRLPKSVGSRLASAIELRLILVAPLRIDLLAWVITDVRRDGNEFDVSVAMAKRARLDQLRLLLDSHGCESWPLGVFSTRGSATFKDYDLKRNGSQALISKPWLIGALVSLFSIPLTIIAIGSILTARVQADADSLRDAAREVRTAERSAVGLEQRRRALAHLFAGPGVAKILNELATKLPATDWLRASERRPDGSFRFVVVTNDGGVLDAALRDSSLLSGLHVVDEAPAGDGMLHITYETDPL